MMIYVTVD